MTIVSSSIRNVALAMIAVTAASIASAQSAPVAPQASTLSRADVVQELSRARAAGELAYGDYSDNVVPAVQTGPGKTRAEVVAELASARAAGELEPGEAYTNGAFDLAPAAPVAVASRLTREQVREEAIAAARTHRGARDGEGS